MTELAAIGPAWAWILAGLLLMGSELAVPGIFLMWLGLAAFLTGLIEAVFDLPWQGQLPLFAGLAVLAVMMGARWNRRTVSDLNRGAYRLIGREERLTVGIVDGSGHVRLDDTLWRVTGPDMSAGTRVRIVGVEGTMLVVAPV